VPARGGFTRLVAFGRDGKSLVRHSGIVNRRQSRIVNRAWRGIAFYPNNGTREGDDKVIDPAGSLEFWRRCRTAEFVRYDVARREQDAIKRLAGDVATVE
jgi:hypothetical protein